MKVRGAATIEDGRGGLRIRTVPETVWSWGLNDGAQARFKGIERREVGPA